MRRRIASRGLTLIEMLTATVLVAVSLMGLFSTWLYMIRGTQLTDERSAAYQIARLVMERARSNGHLAGLSFNGGADPLAESAPVTNNSFTTWISPGLLKYRFFRNNGQELSGGSNADAWPQPPAEARFAVLTQVAYSSTIPAGRDDLRLMTLDVTVYKVDELGSIGTEALAHLQTCLAIGGA
jgi:prepilin-type N-terminal cleavage/methylation domain-containing protein